MTQSPFVDHAFMPGRFSGSCTVMLARHPCPYPESAHQAPNEIQPFGGRLIAHARGTVTRTEQHKRGEGGSDG